MIGYRVIRVLPNEEVVISAAGLRRVVLQPSGEIFAELLKPGEARDMARDFNRLGLPEQAAAVAYAERQSASS